MNDRQLRQLLEEVVSLGDELREKNELDERGKLHPPASSAALDRLTQRFPGKVPASLLQLLAVSNGVDNFDYVDISIFGAEYLLEKADALEEEWVDAGRFEPGQLFVFARSENDSIAVAFELDKPAQDGDQPVIYFDARGTVGQYDGLWSYMRGCRNAIEHNLGLERADRAGLTPDD